MIIDQSIKDEVTKRMKQEALTKECPACRTVGEWKIKIAIVNRIISKTRTTPTKKDFDHPFAFAVVMTCLQCGLLVTEKADPLMVSCH